MQRFVAALRLDWPERKRLHRGLMLGGLVVAYFLAGKLGLHFAFVHASASPVWPPTGIALAAVLLLGVRAWPAIFLGAFLVNISIAGAVVSSIGIAAGNTLEAVVGALLVERYADGLHAFDRARNFLRFIVLAGLISTAISATIGATSLAVTGEATVEFIRQHLVDMVARRRRRRTDRGSFAGPVGSDTASHTARTPFRGAAALLRRVGHRRARVRAPGTRSLPPSVFVHSAADLGGVSLRSAGSRHLGRGARNDRHVGDRARCRPFVMGSDNESLLLLQSFMGTISALTLPVSNTSFCRRRLTHRIAPRKPRPQRRRVATLRRPHPSRPRRPRPSRRHPRSRRGRIRWKIRTRGHRRPRAESTAITVLARPRANSHRRSASLSWHRVHGRADHFFAGRRRDSACASNKQPGAGNANQQEVDGGVLRHVLAGARRLRQRRAGRRVSRTSGIGLLGVSLAFGLTVLTMAYAIGHISGCHLNPAVIDRACGRAGASRADELLPYIVAQVLGGIAGGRAALPDRERQGGLRRRGRLRLERLRRALARRILADAPASSPRS